MESGFGVWIWSVLTNIFSNYIYDFLIDKKNKTTASQKPKENKEFFKFFKRKFEKYFDDKLSKYYKERKESTVFFSNRFADAFPGCRNKSEFFSKEAVYRLSLLLKGPLKVKYQNSTVCPVWYWRGIFNFSINKIKFSKILKRNNEVILNIEHMRINRIVAFYHQSYFRKFVYVETDPMLSTGLYRNSSEYEEYAEYGVLNKRKITRSEYDDGGCVRKGKVIDTRGKAKLRTIHLKQNNFIIAPTGSPINEKQADTTIENILDGILDGSSTLDELAEFIFSLPKKD